MSVQSKNQVPATNLGARMAFALFLLLFVLIGSGNAQTGSAQIKASQTDSKAVQLPAWKSYKDVKIGMTAPDVRSRLGKAASDDKDGLFYIFSDTETVQILLDGEQKVRVISVMYSGEHQNPPKFEDVFGKEVKAEPKPDGAVYKMVRYQEAGYWIAYNRLAGDKAMVTITIQKL